MVLCTVVYNASTGSDTAASGSNAPSTAVTGTNGDIATTTITLNETADLTGASVGDVVWYEGNAGDRHLFTIASFTGGVGSCTAIVVDQTATASRSAKNWAVGGKRQTPDNDTSNADILDGEAGWHFEYEAGTYTYATATTPVALSLQGDTTNGGLVLKAASGASPTIAWTEEAALFTMGGGTDLECRGLIITNTTATTSAAQAFTTPVSEPTLRLLDCTVSCEGACIELDGASIFLWSCDISSGLSDGVKSGGRSNITAINCNFHDCGDEGMDVTSNQTYTSYHIIGCRFDSNGGNGVELNSAGAMITVFIANCVFYNSGGDGVQFNNAPNVDYGAITIFNCIFEANGAYGISGANSGIASMLNWCGDHNAFYNNTSGETQNFTKGSNSITLTASAFVDAAAGDFTLNATSGGGADCKDAGVGYT